MENKMLAVCFVVGLLGILSAAAGFGAEGTRIKGSQVQLVSATQCEYPRSPALGLGLTAAVALMVAQIIINVSAGCICCKRTPQPANSKWSLAVVCFVVSWFMFVIAFLLMLTGAALNDRRSLESMYFGNYYCYVVKPGVFAGGAFLSLASVALGLIYYVTVKSAKNSSTPFGGSLPPNQRNPGAIAMGQPQFPPQNTTQEPVFIHEDTYMRRQFT